MVDGGTASPTQLIELVKAKDHAGIAAALRAGAPLGERDGEDWAALDWAAAGGDQTAIRQLLERGADPTATGGDLRTPYQIALAAGHVDAARILREAEQAAGADPDRYRWTPYCKAYEVAQLRRFAGWRELSTDDGTLPDDGVVFIHDDLTVTGSMWRDQDVIVAEVTEAWASYCHSELGFRVPDDLDLVPPQQAPAT